MSRHLIFTAEQIDAACDEMAGNMFHGGFLTRRALGEPLATTEGAPTLALLAEQMHRDSCAWFPGVHRSTWETVTHAALGLGGETGEVLDVIKKADICGFTETCSMHADGKHSRDALASELADVLTYLLVLAHELGIDVQAAYEAKRAHNVARWGEPVPKETGRAGGGS